MRPSPCLADTSFVADRPPTHFFVKKKFSPIAQKLRRRKSRACCDTLGTFYRVKRCATRGGFVPSLCEIAGGLLLRSYSLQGAAWLYARNPPVRATAWRRHPCHAPDVPKERMGEGTAVGPKGRRWWKDSFMGTNPPICTYRSEARPQSAQKPRCGAGNPPHAGGSFFLYEKSVLRESDCLRGRKPKVCTDLTPPLFRP